MRRLNLRLPDLGDQYAPRKQRAMVQSLEQQLSRVTVDDSNGAYSTTGNFTAGTQDGVVLVDTSGSSVTVTLPEISDDMVRDKYEVELVKISAANTLRVLPTGTDTILGEADAVITVQWTAIRFRAATGNWVAI